MHCIISVNNIISPMTTTVVHPKKLCRGATLVLNVHVHQKIEALSKPQRVKVMKHSKSIAKKSVKD